MIRRLAHESGRNARDGGAQVRYSRAMRARHHGTWIGVTQWSVDGRGPEALHRAAALGFEAIHLSSGEPEDAQRLDDAALREGYLQAARDTGVAISAIAPGGLNDLGLTSPSDSPNARACWDSIRIAIDAAVEMDVPLVFLPSFRAGEIRDAGGMRRTADVLARACDYVAGLPVTIATENTLGADGNLQLLAAAGRPDLRVLLDMQNPVLWGHSVAALVDALWPHLADQVHAKDGRDGEMGNTLLGEGDAGFPESAAALRDRGFAGTVISENDYHGNRSQLAARDIQVMTQAFGAQVTGRPSAPSPSAGA
jgi:2-epi-5-epi-valiolone 7-phosphate 2-epimerase